MQADTTLAPTDAEIEAAYRKVWSTVPHAQRLSAFAHEIASTLAARWGTPAPASGELVAEVMFDERKYIQYTIPLELLPVGAKFYTAPEVRVPLTEKQISKLWSDAHNDTSDRMAHQVLVRLVETAHGITAAQEEAP